MVSLIADADDPRGTADVGVKPDRGYLMYLPSSLLASLSLMDARLS
jgi:hypothetical protein